MSRFFLILVTILAANLVQAADQTQITGTTPLGDYAIEMVDPTYNEQSTNKYWPIHDTTYRYSSTDLIMEFKVTDLTQHHQYSETEKAQKVAVEFEMLQQGYTSTVTNEYPVEYHVEKYDVTLIGHEISFRDDTKPSWIRVIRKDKIQYTMFAVGLKIDEWTAFTESLITHPLNAPDLEKEAQELAAKQAVGTELVGDRQFQAPPYPERELALITGGWWHRYSPPFGAKAPGVDNKLDALWVQCRDGRAAACDELYAGSLYYTGEAQAESLVHYRLFADSCGGRTKTKSCRTLLGGEASEAQDPFRKLDGYPYLHRLGQFDLSQIPLPDSAPPGQDIELDILWDRCGFHQDADGCFKLQRKTRSLIYPGGKNIYEAYALSCGGRTTWPDQNCAVVLLDPKDYPTVSKEAPSGADSQARLLWESCATDSLENRWSSCNRLVNHRFLVPQSDDIGQYLFHAATCGGITSRPTGFDTGCADYSTWPVIDKVEQLYSKPEQ